ncbi:DUF6415 family natural product biosynthesis protein [Streptomyces europaeiscabiei]|uniref:DUF6415 family natural product biosynthesis protein n=1 Tax=Streptomyces europaeiscabiei TaxID=146819 RepID=A0ABU4NQ27_9ACTN|nr:DUF6415 family natural product biosynthesis protein [Streptomyces europaeiscabiei]MDX3555161.1 DUF6415 family natural product biosynthesis protein [Streptomyces europaeiscabiei]MDX3705175.1 DUF6415 family natural product biosynthesis protein [Streptomyces europaeiscabiei]MDX3864414.1 DUF6415 family natural product biosynthesis protein [Streptomyces europaeiscabiei]MDX3871504.1 DUF6415 family natural product biosynthesis protein [Streptomyces europaeiscabiei]
MTNVISEAEAEALPLDLETMREAAARLLAGQAEELSDEDLETMRIQLRGHAELLIPAVDRAATHRPDGHSARRSALACVATAHMNLRLGRGDSHLVRVSVAQKLAHSVRTLCCHLERLGGVGR